MEEWLPPPHQNCKGEGSSNILFHDDFYLMFCFGDTLPQQTKADWFSIFPHFPTLPKSPFPCVFPQSLSWVAFSCMSLHVLMSLSSLFLLMSSILFPVTFICSVFSLQLSAYNCNSDLFWFPSLSLFFFLVTALNVSLWQFLSLLSWSSWRTTQCSTTS